MKFRRLSVHLPVLACTLSMTLLAQGSAARPGDELVGVWGAEPMLGPQVRGELLLTRTGGRWTARVGGFEAIADQQSDSVMLQLPGGQGALRMWIEGRALRGFWVQPAEFDNPRYASPVHLRPAGANTWRGVVHPVDGRFPLYLKIFRDTSDRLQGVFRNPAVNWPGRAGAYGVQRDGDHLAFINARTGKVQSRQAYDSADRTITFNFGVPFVLTPRSLEQAVGLVPRSPGLPPYIYHAPVARGDGWQTAEASAMGVDARALQSIVRSIIAADPFDDRNPRVHSVVVARRGRLILDEYFYGYGPDQMHDLRSASKTVTSIMAGVAMRRSKAFDVSSRVDSTPITVGQLLTHTSGLACDDDDDESPGNEDRMQSQQVQQNWYDFFLALPRVRPGGATYAYCSAGINLVGRVIGQASRAWLPAFFDRYLAAPMQMSTYAMNLMPTGEAYSGGGMRMLPRDLLKFGQLYLAGGVWNGVRLVDASWVTQSTSFQIARPDSSDDGFGWHRHVLTARGRRYQTYEAGGNGGQFVVVIPELDMTVAFTAGNYGQYGVWRKIREELVPQLMAAVR